MPNGLAKLALLAVMVGLAIRHVSAAKRRLGEEGCDPETWLGPLVWPVVATAAVLALNGTASLQSAYVVHTVTAGDPEWALADPSMSGAGTPWWLLPQQLALLLGAVGVVTAVGRATLRLELPEGDGPPPLLAARTAACALRALAVGHWPFVAGSALLFGLGAGFELLVLVTLQLACLWGSARFAAYRWERTHARRQLDAAG